MVTPWWLMAMMILLQPAEEKASYPLSIPPPAGVPRPVYEKLQITGRDDAKLTVHEWAPARAAAGRPVVVFIHGMALHGEPYAAIANGFTSRGIVFVCPDLRGHGCSEGKKGDLADFHVLRADLDKVLDLVNKRHPGAPVVLAGESMGGLIAADYARQRPKRLAGLVLLAPAFLVHATRLQLPKELFTTAKIPISDNHLDASTREPGFAKALKADPLALREVSPGYVTRIGLMGLDWPKAAAEIKLPLFVVVAGRDKIIDNKAVKRAFDQAATPKDDKTFREWEDACHTLCWDPDTPKVMEELARWTLQRRK